MMSALSMKTVWILAWLGLAAQMMATETRNDEDKARNSGNKSEPHKGEAERSLKKRQLNFDGGGRGGGGGEGPGPGLGVARESGHRDQEVGARHVDR